MPTIELKPQSTIQKVFDEASKKGYQPFNWTPPTWEQVSGSAMNFNLEDNTSDYPNGESFKVYNPGPNEQPYKNVPDFIKERRGTKADKDPDADPAGGPQRQPVSRRQWKWPNPASKNEHDDHHEDTPQMRRLGVVFEWAILRATIVLNDINRALDIAAEKPNAQEPEDFDPNIPFSTKMDRYNAVRANYLSFLKDFNDHHAKTGDPEMSELLDQTESRSRTSGYGGNLQWACIAPVIYQGRIQAARIILLWNPHSSSLGVPIKH